MNKELFKNLFIFEMANNHMGDVDHGLRIIRSFSEVRKKFDFSFAFKFQYRDVDSFVHPDYKNRNEFKYVKRFGETKLSESQKQLLRDELRKYGFIAACTPFDEKSVDLVEKHNFDIIKIASCSFTDWPLLERIVKTDKPLIASTAGVLLEDVDKVVSFFEHRNKNFCLMHCVAEYPADKSNLQLNQITLLKKRYPDVAVGYSAHELPDNTDAIKIAIAKGATVFERHVGIKTEKYSINDYSSTPEHVRAWLDAASEAFTMCGVHGDRYEGSDKEKSSLKELRRGIFAKKAIQKGAKIDSSTVFFAIPTFENQFTANNMSKYSELIARETIDVNQPLIISNVSIIDLRNKVTNIVNKIRDLLIESKIILPDKLDMEISHHYGIDKFYEWGATIINCINREYCKKLIILLPGQKHPVHYHEKKEETFHILYGNVSIRLNDEERKYKTGDIIVVERGVKHGFNSENGAIFEEVSTTHYKDDSYYDDKNIVENKNRKTELTFWSDWLLRPIV